jgi:pyrroline-5-carboxylate reductase
MQPVLAIIGTGNLGEAIASSLLRSGWTTPERIVCTDVDADRVARVAATLGVPTAPDAVEAARRAELLLVAVKPQSMRELLGAIAPVVTTGHVVVSVAAGITTAVMESLLPEGTPVVRVMSNTPILVGEAMSAVCGGRHAGEAHLAMTEGLLREVGRVVRVPEADLDAVTAVSGSGPAYVFLLAEAMTAAAEDAGLAPQIARELVVQTVLGAGRLLREDGRDAAELRRMVTSPNGTTQAALEILDERGVAEAVVAAVAAAKRRSEELSAS